MKQMLVDVKTMYQMILGNLRYAYTRNNHLEPSSSYSQTKNLIEEMYIIDENMALTTLKQACSECINDEIVGRFFDGVDDQNGNRKASIEFINWCLETVKIATKEEWKPYNYDLFLKNVEKDDLPLFEIKMYENDIITDLTKEKLASKNQIFNIISQYASNPNSFCYNKVEYDVSNLKEYNEGFKITLLENNKPAKYFDIYRRKSI